MFVLPHLIFILNVMRSATVPGYSLTAWTGELEWLKGPCIFPAPLAPVVSELMVYWALKEHICSLSEMVSAQLSMVRYGGGERVSLLTGCVCPKWHPIPFLL